MAKFRIKTEVNSVSKEVRYCVQYREFFICFYVWLNFFITHDKEQAKYNLNRLIKNNSWK